jgi:hypothetical protein
MPSPESPAKRMTTRSSLTVSGREGECFDLDFTGDFGVVFGADVGVDMTGITRIRRAPGFGYNGVASSASYVALGTARRRLSRTSHLRATTQPVRGFDRTP